MCLFFSGRPILVGSKGKPKEKTRHLAGFEISEVESHFGQIQVKGPTPAI